MTTLWAIILVLIAALIGAFGAVFLKKGSQKLKFKFRSLIKNYYLILGFLLYGVSSVPFILALKGGDLSILYPLVATVYVWIAIFSIKFLGEKMNRWKWLGIALIIFGVALIGLGG